MCRYLVRVLSHKGEYNECRIEDTMSDINMFLHLISESIRHLKSMRKQTSHTFTLKPDPSSTFKMKDIPCCQCGNVDKYATCTSCEHKKNPKECDGCHGLTLYARDRATTDIMSSFGYNFSNKPIEREPEDIKEFYKEVAEHYSRKS